MTYNQFDVVVVPFPFTDGPQAKKRPALVLSSKTFNDKINRYVLAMITSTSNNSWPLDIVFKEPEKANLPKTCMVRMKIFTLDDILIERKLGTLGKIDKENVTQALETLFF